MLKGGFCNKMHDLCGCSRINVDGSPFCLNVMFK